MPSIDDLKSSVSFGKGLALQNRYRVMFSFPRLMPNDLTHTGRHFDMLCDAATIPARTISTFDYQAQKQSYKIANGYSQEEVSFTFLVTNDFMVKKVFDDWTSQIIDFDRYRAGYRKDYGATVEVLQLDKKDNPTYGCKLYNAYPTSVSALAVENSSENSVQKLSVSMAYESFEYYSNMNIEDLVINTND